MKLSDLPVHHALLFTHPDRRGRADALWQELAHESVAHRFFNQTVLDIDTARAIISWAQTPYNDEKIALISFHTATVPAQNAMLKMLEEPRAGVRFILLTSNKENLIGTVLSRVREYQQTDNEEQVAKNDKAHIFLSTPQIVRIQLPFVAELLAATDEEGRKDREGIRRFILSVADTLPKTQSSSRHIMETIEVASYASDPSASGKVLLEYLSFLLPRVA